MDCPLPDFMDAGRTEIRKPKPGEAEPDTAPFTYCRKVQRTDASLKRGGGDSAVAVMAFYGVTAWPTLRPLNRQSVVSSWAAVVAAVVASAPAAAFDGAAGSSGSSSWPNFALRSAC